MFHRTDFRFGPEDLHAVRILIVEDDPIVAADLAETFAARGAEVIGPAATRAEAIRAVESHWIDWAVLDIDLRGETSFPIADRLEAAGIPYVIATGCRRDDLPERFRGKTLIEKPFLARRIAALIAA